MSAADRYDRPAPKPLAQLTRPQVAARVYALRSALDTLAAQSDLDGGAVYECTGAMKKCLISLEAHLREMDRKGPATTLVDALNSPAAVERLKQASAELARIRVGVAR